MLESHQESLIWIFMYFNVARFARNVVKCDIFWEFQTLWIIVVYMEQNLPINSAA